MRDVTLTFDNGPDEGVTPAVLDILAREQIAATFFVLGDKLEDRRNRALCERAVGEGHWVGNHTYSHATPLGNLDEPGVAEAEIGRTQALIGELAGKEKLFRPFGGGGVVGTHLLSEAALHYLTANRFTCVLWNVVPRDWEETETWPERAMAMMAHTAWSLVVIHDVPSGAMLHLPRFIDKVRAAGGTFRQDFPPECVPLRSGRAALPMVPFVTPSSGKLAASIGGEDALRNV